jgi:hypothetical protein
MANEWENGTDGLKVVQSQGLRGCAVWKFALELVRPPWILEMPRGARLLDVQLQDGAPKLWAVVDVGAPLVGRRLRIVGTGHDLDGEVGEHVGTFLTGPLAIHVFDLGECAPKRQESTT